MYLNTVSLSLSICCTPSHYLDLLLFAHAILTTLLTHCHIVAAMAFSTDYGRRLLPRILDDLASAEPDRILYSISTSSDTFQGFQQVSARTFAKAVDKTAWLLRGQIGGRSTLQSVGYIGPRKFSPSILWQTSSQWRAHTTLLSYSTDDAYLDDLRHILLTYACVKINCTVCSTSAHLHLVYGSAS
jgi:hypothetical protein